MEVLHTRHLRTIQPRNLFCARRVSCSKSLHTRTLNLRDVSASRRRSLYPTQSGSTQAGRREQVFMPLCRRSRGQVGVTDAELTFLRKDLPRVAPETDPQTLRHSATFRFSVISLQCHQPGALSAPRNSHTARATASGCSNSRKCPARGRSTTRTRSPNCSRNACPFPGGAASSSSP